MKRKFELASLYLGCFVYTLCSMCLVFTNPLNASGTDNSNLKAIIFVLGVLLTILFCYISDSISRKQVLVISSVCLILSYSVLFIYPVNNILTMFCQGLQSSAYLPFIVIASIKILEGIKIQRLQPLALEIKGFTIYLASFIALILSHVLIKDSFNEKLVFSVYIIFAIILTIFFYVNHTDTKEFIEAKNNKKSNSKIDKKQFLYACFISSVPLINFYFVFLHFSSLLKTDLNYSQADMVLHNVYLCIIILIRSLVNMILSWKIHPVKVSQYILYPYVIIILFIPLIATNITYYKILILQVSLILFNPYLHAIEAVIIRNFSITRRFTLQIILVHITPLTVYFLTSFIFRFLFGQFGYYSIYLIYIPILFCFKKA